MPDEAPDRAIAAVLQAVETTPQVRVVRPFWSQNPMKSSLVGAAAAAVVVVAAGVLILSRPPTQPTVGASPTVAPSVPAVSPSAPTPGPSGSAAAAIPSPIQHLWLGAHNDLLTTGNGAALALNAGSLSIATASEVRRPVLTAAISAVGADQLIVTSSGPLPRCDAGQAGTYAWSLSTSGRSLTLRAVGDPCAQRSAVLATTWNLVACQEPTDNCLGPIDAGTYASQFMNFQHPAESWTPNLGAITYTVPDGWANTGDWPDHFELVPMASFPGTTGPDGPDHLIDITADVRAESAATPCSGKTAAVATTPAAIAGYLRTIPGLVVSASSPITIDGKTGLSVDLAVDTAKVRPCDSTAVVEYLVGHTTNSGLLSTSAGRLILLPVGSSTVSIEIVAPTSDFTTFADAAMPIVTSLKLH